MKLLRIILVLLLLGVLLAKLLLRDAPRVNSTQAECARRHIDEFIDHPITNGLASLGAIVVTGANGDSLRVTVTTAFGIPLMRLEIVCEKSVKVL